MGSIASTVLYPIYQDYQKRLSRMLMNVKARCVAADSIYANNANRKFCTKYGISTSFVRRKQRAAKDELFEEGA